MSRVPATGPTGPVLELCLRSHDLLFLEVSSFGRLCEFCSAFWQLLVPHLLRDGNLLMNGSASGRSVVVWRCYFKVCQIGRWLAL